MRRVILSSALFFVFLFLSPAWCPAEVIEPSLLSLLQSSAPSDDIPVLINLADEARLDLIGDSGKKAKRTEIIRALQEKADLTQQPIMAFLQSRGAKRLKPLWIRNAVAATLSSSVIQELKEFPGVGSIALDSVSRAPVPVLGAPGPYEWNINTIHAPELWALGFTGQGIVIAGMDTGVDYLHPDLSSSWRGGTNSWYDPNNEHASAPFDAHGHGTGTMGVMVGGAAGGSSIGVAPGAQWIAVKIFNDAGVAADSIIHQGFQWLLDPDGDPKTDDAPDIVNNSWGDEVNGRNLCTLTFKSDLEVLKSAGIAVVFSAGNLGPSASSSISPANNPGVYSSGATDASNTIASFSSRGPSACDGSIFPTIAAPGVSIRTADLTAGGVITNSYAVASGTSFAAPHIAGAMALLYEAFPKLTLSQLEAALMNSALDLGAVGPDSDYGNGLLDVLKAYHLLTSDKVGVFSDGIWHQDISGDGAWGGTPPDRLYSFGAGLSGAIPVTGDWDGSGAAKIGVYQDGIWYLDYDGSGVWGGTPPDRLYSFGAGLSGAIPVTGDWDGSGAAKIGVYQDGIWYLDYNGSGVWEGSPADRQYSFGGGLSG
ncbi:MAG: hypothetical protein EPN25_10765, partial [Nitrospirae bacterium]